jgi:hypothetical protein
VTAPMTPAPAPGPAIQEVPGTPPPVAPEQAPPPTDSPPGGGQSATDAAAGDPMAWLTAAELDARYAAVERPTTTNGQMGA